MREDALVRARDTAEGLSLLLSRDVERNLEIVEVSLRTVAEGTRLPSLDRLSPDLRQRILFGGAANARDIGAVLVIDAMGNITYDSRQFPAREANVADRDYFRIQLPGQFPAEPYISKPFLPRIGERIPTIGLSEPLNDGAGNFSGIVLGALRLDYFRRLFDGAALGQHGSITLLRTDGIVLMRRPFHQGDIGASLAGGSSFLPLLQSDTGTYVGTAVLDRTQRLYSFRHIGKYPLIVVVGLATKDIYAEWQRRALAIGGVMGTLAALLILTSFLFSAELKRRREAERRLKMQAEIDCLTGVGTRRALDASLEGEFLHAAQCKSPLAVLMVDVDLFKIFNDLYGHLAGDEALRIVASCIQTSLSQRSAFAGRFGGEEFCVVLRDANMDAALEVAQAIRRRVWDSNIPHSASPTRRLTICVGVAVTEATDEGGFAPKHVLDLADRQLYAAKLFGRNAVMPAAQ